jgi:protein gp37
MSEQTKIAWCDSTVNPVQGCDKVSDGCKNCYITTTTPFRVSGMKHGDPRTFHPSALKLAEKLNRKPWVCGRCGSDGTLWPPNGDGSAGVSCVKCGGEMHRRRIFWESLGDIWDKKWKIEWLASTLDTIRRCDQCVHILVSKRWENFSDRIRAALCHVEKVQGDWPSRAPETDLGDWLNWWECGETIPSNIIGLCSVENQENANNRIPQFLTVPLAGHGLSMEPLLGEIRLKTSGNPLICPESIGRNGLKWLIIGGESGANARPCNVDWIRSIVQQGKAAGVATFVKQLGSLPSGLDTGCDACDAGFRVPKRSHGLDCSGRALIHTKGGDPSEWPQDLRVQQWPKGF